MANTDAFALKNSGLNEFLFAEVGTETNGLPLTVLSLLARLGRDPWVEAARLVRLPKAAAIDFLESCMSEMPLDPRALAEARATAARVTQLLPSQTASRQTGATAQEPTATVPEWIPMAVFAVFLFFGIAFAVIPPMTSSSAAQAVAATTHHTPTHQTPSPK